MADKIEMAKKRKRNPDGSAKPSKRVAIEEDKQVKITLHGADKWAPVIALTPGVAIPSSIVLKPYTKNRRNAPQKTGLSGDVAIKDLLLHSSAHPKLDYTAREEEPGGTDALLKHYVGVYDPDTGKLEVMEARKMVVRGSVRAHQQTAQDEISTNMRELRNDLGQTFGTKKAKKAIASVTENAISPDRAARLADGGRSAKLNSGAMAVLANIGEVAAGMATQEELAQEAEAAKPRPQGNYNATDIKDVYTVEVLIGIDIMALIPVKEWKDTITSKQEVRTSSRYVSSRLGRGTPSVEKLKLLRYMLLLIEFFAKARPARGGRMLPKRDEVKQILNGMPEAVLEGVKRKFTTAGMLNKYQSDLLITHLCAMACLVDNFEVDMYDLQLDLRLETKEMSQYFHEIGAKVGAFSASEGKKMGLDKAMIAQRRTAKLKLPLDFPKVSFGRKR